MENNKPAWTMTPEEYEAMLHQQMQSLREGVDLPKLDTKQSNNRKTKPARSSNATA